MGSLVDVGIIRARRRFSFGPFRWRVLFEYGLWFSPAEKVNPLELYLDATEFS